MFWIALRPTHDGERQAWSWRALQFTPRVAVLDEAIVLEVSASERLWGGRKRLLRKLFKPHEALSMPPWATADTSLAALGFLRLQLKGEAASSKEQLPIDVLSAARDHAVMLERIGCRTWADLRALPTAGLSRRFGKGLVAALDRAFGTQPEAHEWLQLPQDFDVKHELPALATSAPELMWTAQRLLSQLQLWLQARNRGVLSLELEWTLDLRRLNGKPLPPTEKLEVRTAQPTQDMAHLRRLVSEHLSRSTIAAPANHLRLRSVETVPWGGATTSLLPEDNRKGEKLHELVERLSVRLGEDKVLVPSQQSDHRPERMQRWLPARQHGGPRRLAVPAGHPSATGDSVYPTWLLPKPLPLEVKSEVPHYGGPLRRLTRLYRVETGWWEEGGPALRDYFIASSDEAGLVWIFRERPASTGKSRWYLQGLYA